MAITDSEACRSPWSEASRSAGEPAVATPSSILAEVPRDEEEVVSQKRLSMRKIRELLRLKYELGRSHREIAASLGVSTAR